MKQADIFLNGHWLVKRIGGGAGVRWWLVSLFQDGSLRVSTASITRTFNDAREALDYLACYEPPLEGVEAFEALIEGLESLIEKAGA